MSGAAYVLLVKHVLAVLTAFTGLNNITMSHDEIEYLRKICTYLSEPYLHYMSSFRLRPQSQVNCNFVPLSDTGSDSDIGDIHLHVEGLWLETILYEIPLLALTSEAYFKFMDRDWTYDNQTTSAKEKGLKLTENGCLVSEFGSRRRRDYHTHELILHGLIEAQKEAETKGHKGEITGTSNVHFAMRFGIPPIGTVAHEWFMGVAAVTGNYPSATETALRYWIATFGKGVLGIALTDTFGTPEFLKAFRCTIPSFTAPGFGKATTGVSAKAPSTAGKLVSDTISNTEPPIQASGSTPDGAHVQTESYADVFTGTRQDSGDPLEFVKVMREFYDREGIKAKKTIVFSDSLNVDRCIEYKEVAEKAGFQPSFGIGTFFTSKWFKNTVITPPLLICKQMTSCAHQMVRSRHHSTSLSRSLLPTASLRSRSVTTLVRTQVTRRLWRMSKSSLAIRKMNGLRVMNGRDGMPRHANSRACATYLLEFVSTSTGLGILTS